MATFNTLVISKIQRETSKAISISFDVPESLKNTYAFEAGQYLTLKTKIDGQEMWSPYNAMSDNPILHSDPLGDTSILSNQFKTLKQGWDDFNQGKGPAYKSLDFFNRTFNPLTDIYHSFTGKDYITGEIIFPFGDFTKISCDNTSNYFVMDLNSLPTNRTYKLKLKIVESGISTIIDDKLIFQIID